ncbi:uncharacterized protein LOC113768765 [Coffea eugenioides]|uniref:Uncharacterized protein isoform X1 n=2 Tax=Coffea arabica TaxID=13443 RepID=A0A6P6TZF9_COFAR|nr:uncharacterized protein LOC113705527 [Coffea arabica]XP_027169074.1 uncharacterized protein LOC113768765 [Coffea eugenioides]
MATVVLSYVQNLWPFSILKDDLRVSNSLVKKLPIPESTKRFVYAIQEPESGAVIYVLCVQNLSERSALDAECLIKVVKPDAVLAQVGPSIEGNEFSMEKIASEACSSPDSYFSAKSDDRRGNEFLLPTSAFEVLRRCFLHKINKEKYENVAGSLVLREIFGVSFNGHFFSAKRAAEEVGAAFFLLESPFVKCSGDGKCSSEMDNEEEEVVEVGLGTGLRGFGIQPNSLVPQKGISMASMSLRRFSAMNDVQSWMVKSLSRELSNLSSVLKVGSEDVQPRVDYEAPQFSQSIYPLLVDLHDIFVDIPYMGSALAHAQKMLSAINKGEAVDGQLLSEVHVFRIAVEGLRIALNDAARLPINKLGNPLPSKCEFSELPVQEKSHALIAQALQSQTTKFKSIVALVDANGLAGLRKHWNTPVPVEIKNMVQQLVTNCENDRKILSDKKALLSAKPILAVGAGATAVLGASSLSKVVPASSLVKILTFNVPASLKLMVTQTYKVVALTFGKSVGPSKVIAPGVASGVKTSFLKAAASAEKIRAVAHSIIASVEKTSLSATRTAFYEIMRKRHVQPVGFLPWATFGCSIATCAGLLMYGDGIECAVESVPAAPSIASLGRGVQSLHLASQAVRQAESSKIQKSIESLLDRFRKMKVQ